MKRNEFIYPIIVSAGLALGLYSVLKTHDLSNKVEDLECDGIAMRDDIDNLWMDYDVKRETEDTDGKED